MQNIVWNRHPAWSTQRHEKCYDVEAGSEDEATTVFFFFSWMPMVAITSWKLISVI